MSGNIWFTSDLHLRHAKVAELRGFDSSGDHDDAVADMWSSTVRRNDQVWVLGDVTGSTSKSAVASAMFRLMALPGQKHLILGNHDAAHPMYRDAFKRSPEYSCAFASVAMAGRRRIEGRNVLLSHFPYERDREETRHAQWRLRNEGLWLIHGHTHGEEQGWLTEYSELANGEEIPATREVHVGLDAWDQQLVHLDTVAEVMDRMEEP